MGGEKQTSDSCADGTGGLRGQVDEESRKRSRCRSDPERPVSLNYPCHYAILMREPVTLVFSQAETFKNILLQLNCCQPCLWGSTPCLHLWILSFPRMYSLGTCSQEMYLHILYRSCVFGRYQFQVLDRTGLLPVRQVKNVLDSRFSPQSC